MESLSATQTPAPRRAAPVIWASVAAVVVMGAGGLMTDRGAWYQNLVKPDWQPPGWVFGPAWTTIFALVVLAASYTWLATPSASARRRLVLLFAVNGALNVGWSFLFFQMQRPDWALAEVVLLWLSIAALITTVLPRSRKAALLMMPYLAWVTFATLLNYEVVRLNAPF